MLKIVGSDLNTDVYRGQLDRCLHISFSVYHSLFGLQRPLSFSLLGVVLVTKLPQSSGHIGFQIDLIMCLQQIDPKFRSIAV